MRTPTICTPKIGNRYRHTALKCFVTVTAIKDDFEEEIVFEMETSTGMELRFSRAKFIRDFEEAI